LVSSHSSYVSSNNCISVTAERAYYYSDRFFIKRSLRPSEFKTGYKGLYIPRLGKERLRNKVESLRFLRSISKIPVLVIYSAFEIDNAFFLVTEFVNSTAISELSEDKKRDISVELNQHLATLHELKSQKIGGPSGIVIPPYRVIRYINNNIWPAQSSVDPEYIFYYNDLS
jgi:hypothetical protein